MFEGLDARQLYFRIRTAQSYGIKGSIYSDIRYLFSPEFPLPSTRNQDDRCELQASTYHYLSINTLKTKTSHIPGTSPSVIVVYLYYALDHRWGMTS